MEPRHYKYWPKHLPKRLTIPSTTLWYNLEVAATRYPDRAVTVFYDSRLSYAEFLRQAEALVGYLQRRCGVKKGDRVLTQAGFLAEVDRVEEKTVFLKLADGVRVEFQKQAIVSVVKEG